MDRDAFLLDFTQHGSQRHSISCGSYAVVRVETDNKRDHKRSALFHYPAVAIHDKCDSPVHVLSVIQAAEGARAVDENNDSGRGEDAHIRGLHQRLLSLGSFSEHYASNVSPPEVLCHPQ